METDFNLSVKFGVDTSGMDKALKGVQKSVKKATDKINASFDNVADDVEKSAEDMADSFEDATDKMESDAKRTGKKIADKMEDSAEDSERAFEKMGSGIKKVFGAIAGAVAIDKITDSLNNLAEVSLETRSNMSKLTTAFKSNNGSAKTAKKTYGDLYGVLGDTDKALEASQLLSHLTTNQKNLSEWTDILTGVYAEFGDSLPVESLAESANETAKVGEVTGVLADALNWAGISEEEFNKALAKCNTEAERERLIRSTLNDEYAKSAEMYKENNKEAIAYRNAQQELNDAMADIGTAVLPIKTELMEIGASILSHFQEPITNALEIVKTKLSEAKTKVSDFVQTAEFQNLISAVSDFGGAVKDVALTAWTELRNRVVEIWDKFGDTSVTGNLTTVAEDLTEAFSGLNEFLKGDSFLKNLLVDGALLGTTLMGLGKVKTSVFDPLKEGVKTLLSPISELKKSFSEGSLSDTGAWFGSIKSAITKGSPWDDVDFIDEEAMVYQLKDSKFNDFARAFNDKLMTAISNGSKGGILTNLGALGGVMKDGLMAKIAPAFAKISAFCNPVTLAIGAVIGIIVLLWNKCEGFRDAMLGVWENVKSTFTEVWNVLKEELGAVWESLKPLIDEVIGFVKDLFGGVGDSAGSLGEKLQPLWDVLAWIANLLIDVLGGALKFAIKHFSWVMQIVIECAKVLWDFLEPLLKIAGTVLKGLFSAIAELVGWFVEFVVEGFKGIGDICKKLWGIIKEQFGKIGNNLVENKEEFGKWWDGVKGFFSNALDFILNLPDKIKNGLGGMVNIIKDTMTDMWNKGVASAVAGANNLIGIINDVLEKIGLPTIDTINPTAGQIKTGKHESNKRSGFLAKGTNNWRGGNAVVGEAGRELVSDPKLGTFLASSPMLLNLSTGASVLRNSKTEQLLKGIGVGMYADGKNESMWDKFKNTVSNIWDYIKNPSKVVDDIWNALSFGGDGFIGQAFGTWIKSLKSKVLDFITAIFNKDEVQNNPNNTATVAWNSAFAGSGKGYAQAMSWAKKALEIAGYVPRMKEYQDFMTAYKIVGRYESNYNNTALNDWDDNAKKGTPSAGWLQFIQPTFKSYAFKGYNNWSDGLHQALAFINYANRKYGGALQVPGVKSILKGGKYKPYANGGLISSPTVALMGEAGTEAVVPLTAGKVKPFGQAVVNELLDMVGGTNNSEQELTVNVPIYLDSVLIGKSTAKVVQSEIQKFDKRNNRLNGIK